MAREIARVPKTTIQVFKGRDKTITSKVLDKDEQIVDISMVSAIEFGIAKKPDAKAALISKSIGAGVTITDGPNGAYQIDITDTDTDNLAPGRYFHECVVTDGNGKESTVLWGEIELEASFIST